MKRSSPKPPKSSSMAAWPKKKYHRDHRLEHVLKFSGIKCPFGRTVFCLPLPSASRNDTSIYIYIDIYWCILIYHWYHHENSASSSGIAGAFLRPRPPLPRPLPRPLGAPAWEFTQKDGWTVFPGWSTDVYSMQMMLFPSFPDFLRCPTVRWKIGGSARN